MDVAFTPDGNRLLVLLADGVAEGRLRGWVRELDLDSGESRTVVDAEEFPGPPWVFLDGAFADDASTVVMWTLEAQPRAILVDLRDGSRTPLSLTGRPDVDLVEFVALPAGAAQLWDDGAVILFDRAGQQVQTLTAHEAAVRDVLVDPTGVRAATAGDDGTIVIWDIDQNTGGWSIRERLIGHTGAIEGIELDPTGRVLYTAASDGRVIAWDMTADAGFGSTYPGLADRWISNRPQMVGHDNLMVAPTRPVSRTGGGGIEAVATEESAAVAASFIDAATGRVVDEVEVGATNFNALFGSSVAVSPDGRQVAVTSGYATTVLDTRTREVLGQIVLPAAEETGPDGEPLPELVWGAGWTPDGARLLLCAAVDGLVVVDPSTWQIERRVRLGGPVQTVEPSPDGRLLVAASGEVAQAWVLDAATLETRHEIQTTEPTHDLSFSADGRWLAMGGGNGGLSVLDTSTWRPPHEPVRVDNLFVQQVEWLPDGRTVTASGASGAVALYDVRRGVVRARPLPGSDEPGAGYTTTLPEASGELVALSGERAGHRYPMSPAVWLAEACAIVERDLSAAEWARYLPGRAYQPTCSDLS